MKRIVVLILRQTRFASGLKMDVVSNYHAMCGEIKFPSGTINFLISRREQEFSERWGGYLMMAVAGTCNLFITSDDGSRLFVDRVLVIGSGRIYGITEKTGLLISKSALRRLCWTISRVGVRLA